MNPHIHPAVKAAIESKFGTRPALPDGTQRGDDLPTKFARRLGIPVIERPETDKDDVPVPGKFVTDSFGRQRYIPTRAFLRGLPGAKHARRYFEPRRSPRRSPIVDQTPRVSVVARRARRAVGK